MAAITGQQIEFANRSRLVSRLFELGFEVFVPIIDTGVDLAAYRAEDKALRLIQLKTRWTIDRKYFGRDIWIAFPAERVGEWYLAPHDEMVSLGEARGYCATSSWKDRGLYHMSPLPGPVAEAMQHRRVTTR